MKESLMKFYNWCRNGMFWHEIDRYFTKVEPELTSEFIECSTPCNKCKKAKK